MDCVGLLRGHLDETRIKLEKERGKRQDHTSQHLLGPDLSTKKDSEVEKRKALGVLRDGTALPDQGPQAIPR